MPCNTNRKEHLTILDWLKNTFSSLDDKLGWSYRATLWHGYSDPVYDSSLGMWFSDSRGTSRCPELTAEVIWGHGRSASWQQNSVTSTIVFLQVITVHLWLSTGRMCKSDKLAWFRKQYYQTQTHGYASIWIIITCRSSARSKCKK